MKSDVDIKDDVYKVIASSALKNAVTGSICKRKRTAYPVGTELMEDICIAVLANQTSQLQEAFVNVNIYIQDVDVNGQEEENTKRLREICQLCFKVFEAVHGKDFRLSLSEQRVIEVTGSGEHIVNNKLLYQILND